MGKRVLLIDADLRRAGGSTGSANGTVGPGLSEILAGANPAMDAVERDEELGFSVVHAGEPSASPVALLSADRIKAVIDRLAADHDIVIIDGPPIMGLADAVLLARNVEAVLVVVEANKTLASELDVAVSRLPQHTIMGGILTKFDPKSAGVNYGGYDYYNYQQQS